MSSMPSSDFNNSHSRPLAEHLPIGVARCTSCGAIGYTADLFCACCGRPMPKRCKTCGSVVHQQIANYCTQCGAPM